MLAINSHWRSWLWTAAAMAFKKKGKKVKVNKKKRKEFEKKKRRRKRRRSSCAANSSNISSNISVCVWVLQPCCIMPLRTKKKKNSLLTMNAQVGTILLRKPQTKVNHFASEATSGPRAFVTHRPRTKKPPQKSSSRTFYAIFPSGRHGLQREFSRVEEKRRDKGVTFNTVWPCCVESNCEHPTTILHVYKIK